MERVSGLEPVYPRWQRSALPLSYTRKNLDGGGGIEPRIQVFKVPCPTFRRSAKILFTRFLTAISETPNFFEICILTRITS